MTIELASPEMQQDPYPAYAAMRQQKTAVLVEHSLTGEYANFLTRYEDVVKVLKDSRFINDSRKLPGATDLADNWLMPTVLKRFLDSMALADEPDHSRLRNLVHKAFTPSMIQQLAGTIEQMANDYLDRVRDKAEVDFISAFALPLPLNVIADMMGVPQRDRRKVSRWMGDTITNFSPNDRLGMLPKLYNAFALNRFLEKLAAKRRRQPQDDLTTALVQAEAEGEKLSEAELISMLLLILFAGHETTVNLIGSGLLALLQNPDQFELLKAQPELLDSAIEELLRYTNPVQHIAMRYATEEVTLGEVIIPPHKPVYLCIAAANRDETVFEQPERLDIQRKPNRHIAFGFGIHYCLGAPLARLEAKIAFQTLLRRFPNMSLAVAPEALRWRGAPSLRGLAELPVRLNG